jgi:hypothetical protein
VYYPGKRAKSGFNMINKANIVRAILHQIEPHHFGIVDESCCVEKSRTGGNERAGSHR